MPEKKYIVDLSAEEREQLQGLIRRGVLEGPRGPQALDIAAAGRSRRAAETGRLLLV